MLATVLSALLFIERSGASGFDYPDTMPPPSEAQINFALTHAPYFLTHETPIQGRLNIVIQTSYWNCLAVYHPTALDILTQQAPIRADNDTINNYGTDETMVLCALYSNLIVLDVQMNEATADLQALFAGYGMDSSLITVNEDVAACDVDNDNCLQSVAADNGYIPEIMASIVAYRLLDYFADDGWNQDGELSADASECTANCIPYGDTTGYEPIIGDYDHWQPLFEHNGKGFSYYYNHVTPHIGFTAKPRFLSMEELESRSSPDPEYCYETETKKVVKRLGKLAEDDYQKMMVEFFDDKGTLAFTIALNLGAALNWTYQDRVFWTAGFSGSEYDSIIQAWREKLNWDLVRPTTLIKQGIAGDMINTYGGPYQGKQNIKAQDFESYHRVMPHSEYPSGSGCICLTYQQFNEIFLTRKYGIDPDTITIDIPFPNTPFYAGSSSIEPGTTPSEDLYVTLDNLAQMKEICGESRLWGGMHFTAAIEGSYELCDGIGEIAYEYMVNLMEGNVDYFVNYR